MTNEINIKLSYFEGDYSKEEINNILGICSDDTSSSEVKWMKCWKYNPKVKLIENEFENVVNDLYNKRDQILRITNESELSISGCLYTTGSIGIHFKKDVLQKLGELNIPLDIDIYDLSEDQDS